MNNNDILRRLRFAMDLNDSKMVGVFREAEVQVTRADISSWLKKDDDPELIDMMNIELASFLNGLINLKRGKKDGPQVEPEKQLTNNMVFRKLKIAFNLIDDDVVSIMALTKVKISKHELSAFFRKADHRNFRKCNDQVLRNFLKGLQIKLRPSSGTPKKEAKPEVKSKPEKTQEQNKEQATSVTTKSGTERKKAPSTPGFQWKTPKK